VNVAGCICIFLVVTVAGEAQAQDASRRLELGIVASGIRFVEFDPVPELKAQWLPSGRARIPKGTWLEGGIGGRAGYRLSKHLKMEGEVVFFPQYAGRPFDGAGPMYRGWGKIQALAGVVAGRRFGAATLFMKTRPGAVRFERFPEIFMLRRFEEAVLLGSGDSHPRTCLAVDIGGGVEYPVSSRVVLRFDLGDTVIRYRPSPSELNPKFSRHNVQAISALGFRFVS